MECKGFFIRAGGLTRAVEIDTLWNVKDIETKQNVIGESRNRYIVECKVLRSPY